MPSHAGEKLGDLLRPRRGAEIGQPLMRGMTRHERHVFREIVSRLDPDFCGEADNRAICMLARWEVRCEQLALTPAQERYLNALRAEFGLTPRGRKVLTSAGKEKASADVVRGAFAVGKPRLKSVPPS